MQIDLNADMGEGFGPYRIGQDEELLGIVTSANVACGFHAGDATIMHRLALLAKKRGVGLEARIPVLTICGASAGAPSRWMRAASNILSPIRSAPYRPSLHIPARRSGT
jgi:hypothetical protein